MPKAKTKATTIQPSAVLTKHDYNQVILHADFLNHLDSPTKYTLSKFVFSGVPKRFKKLKKAKPDLVLPDLLVISVYHDEPLRRQLLHLCSELEINNALDKFARHSREENSNNRNDKATFMDSLSEFFGDRQVSAALIRIKGGELEERTNKELEKRKSKLSDMVLTLKKQFRLSRCAIHQLVKQSRSEVDAILDKGTANSRMHKERDELRNWVRNFDDQFESMRIQGLTISQMQEQLRSRDSSLLPIGRSTYYEKIIKSRGYK